MAFSTQELVILNSALNLYCNKYGESENSIQLEVKIKDQLINTIIK